MSDLSAVKKPTTLEERLEVRIDDKFTSLSLAINDIPARMDERNQRRDHQRDHSHTWCWSHLEDNESYGDNNEGDWREYWRKDDDIKSIKI